MSTARQPEHSTIQHNNSFYHNVIKGGLVGPISYFATHFIDRAILHIHITPPSKVNIKSAIITNPLNGYIPGTACAFVRHLVMFPAKSFYESKLNEYFPNHSSSNGVLAGFFAGITAAYPANPLSVVRTKRYNNEAISEIKKMSFRDYFKGANTTAARDSVHFGFYFTALTHLSEIFNPLVAGALAGLTGSLASNPFAVIANHQKSAAKPISAWRVAFSIFKDEGPNGFFKKWLQTTSLRMSVQGCSLAGAMSLAEYLINLVEQKKDLSRSNRPK